MAMTPCRNARLLLAQAPSTRVAGRGARPRWSAITWPRWDCPSNKSAVKLPT